MVVRASTFSGGSQNQDLVLRQLPDSTDEEILQVRRLLVEKMLAMQEKMEQAAQRFYAELEQIARDALDQVEGT